jgi:hypothetical protein
MSAPGMKEHNANIWTREGADGRLCQPRALAIEARRAETRERLRSRERSRAKRGNAQRLTCSHPRMSVVIAIGLHLSQLLKLPLVLG